MLSKFEQLLEDIRRLNEIFNINNINCKINVDRENNNYSYVIYDESDSNLDVHALTSNALTIWEFDDTYSLIRDINGMLYALKRRGIKVADDLFLKEEDYE